MFLRGESFGIIMISQSQAEQMLNTPGEINQVLVDFDPGTDPETLKYDIEGILRPYGLLTSYPQQEQYSEKKYAISNRGFRIRFRFFAFPKS